eukprot:scaffold13136_cov30-Tisochrysis_lutea.AAC.5
MTHAHVREHCTKVNAERRTTELLHSTCLMRDVRVTTNLLIVGSLGHVGAHAPCPLSWPTLMGGGNYPTLRRCPMRLAGGPRHTDPDPPLRVGPGPA